MEIVLSKLENTNITPNNERDKTSFDTLYKNWGRLGNQEERRKEILEIQKSNRNNKLDQCRGILELVQAVEENNIFEHTKAFYRPSIYVAGFNKAPSYKEVLMMSEWLIEKPADFETNWMVVPVPKGTRVLVVANNGITRLFSKHGHLLLQCNTALPGGSRASPKHKFKCCVLDGFYNKKSNELYLLDLLAWNSQPMTDGEFDFRDHWLRSRLSEIPGLLNVDKKNEIKFEILPKVSCAKESFNNFMMKIHFEDITKLDGLLFFHTKAHYCSGETPLVGWLFPYMVPEVIGSDVTVNSVYIIQKPVDYVNQAKFITEFNAKMEKKSRTHREQRRRKNSNEMDTAEVKQEEKQGNTASPAKKMDTAISVSNMENKCENGSQEGDMEAEVTSDTRNETKP